MDKSVEQKLQEIISNTKTITAVAVELKVSRQTIYKWLSRYKRSNIEIAPAIQNRKQPSAHNKIRSEIEEVIINVAQKYPEDSVSTLTSKLQQQYKIVLNPATVFRILKRNNIRYAPQKKSKPVKVAQFTTLSTVPTKEIQESVHVVEQVENPAIASISSEVPVLSAPQPIVAPVSSPVRIIASPKAYTSSIFLSSLYNRKTASILLLISVGVMSTFGVYRFETGKASVRPIVRAGELSTPSFDSYSETVITRLSLPKTGILDYVVLSPRSFSTGSFAATVSTFVKNRPHDAKIALLPLAAYQSLALGGYKVSAAKDSVATLSNKSSLALLDRLSLSVYCGVLSFSKTINGDRCNYDKIASGVATSSVAVLGFPVEKITTGTITATTATTTSIPSGRNTFASAASPVYITKYVTEYVGIPGPKGEDGRAGKDGKNGSDGVTAVNNIQAPLGIGSYIIPSYSSPSNVIGISTIGYLKDTTIESPNITGGTATNLSFVSPTLSNTVFSGSSLFNDAATFTGSVAINNLTAASSTLTDTVLTNSTTTNAYIANLAAASSTITDLIVANAFIQNLTIGSSTLSISAIDVLVSDTLTVNATSTLATTTITQAVINNASTTNLSATNAVLANATSTSLFASLFTAITGFFTDLTTTNATTTNLVATNASTTNLSATNTVFTNSTTTNAYIENLTIGSSTMNSISAGDISLTGGLTVNGTTTLATTTVTDFVASRATSTNFFSTLLTAVTGFFTDLTATNAILTNATSTNFTATNLQSAESTFINSTTTRAYIANLAAANSTTTNAYITSLVAGDVLMTNSTSTRNYVATLIAGSSTLADALITRSTTTNAYIASLVAASSTLVDAIVTNLVATNASLMNATSTNLAATNFNATNGFLTNATSTDSFAINFRATNATTTNFASTNATLANATSTNFFATLLTAVTGFFTDLTATNATLTNATLTNATSTNFFSTLLTAVTGFFTDLTATNATLTNATSTNLYSMNAVLQNATVTFFEAINASTTNATTTRAYITSLVAASSTLTDAVLTRSTTTDAYIARLVAGSSTLTNAIITTLNATDATFTNATSTNLFATNEVTTNSTSTNAFATNLSATNATSTNFFATLLNAATAIFTNLTATNATLTNATSTNLFTNALNAITGTINTLTGGSITATSSLTSNGTLNVTGQTTLGNASTTNLSTSGTLNVAGKTTFTNASGTALTVTDLYATNATFSGTTTFEQTAITEISATNINAIDATFTNATSTNFFATLLNAATAFFTNLTATNATLTNATSTNLFVSILNAVTGTVNTLTGGSITATSSLTSNGTLSVTGQTTLGNASTTGLTATNLYATNATSSTLYSTLVNAITAGFTNLTATNSTTTNATSTNFFATTGRLTDAFIAGLVATNATTTNSTSTNLFATNFTATNVVITGTLQATGGLDLGNASTTDLSVSGDFYTSLATGSVPFIGAAGLLAENNSMFFWDNANGRLGVGTSTPTSTLTVGGNMTIAGSILPSETLMYDLGSPTQTWHSLYVGPGSLYVNGQKVLQTDLSNSVVVSADPNQNLIQKTTGTGNIELNASGVGQILLKSNIILSGGKTFRTSDLTPVNFVDGTKSGNVTVYGNTIQATDLNGGLSIAATGTGNVYITSGNLGIGDVSPTNKLDVAGSIGINDTTVIDGSRNLVNIGTITSGLINGQTISSAANFTGTLNVAGKTTFTNASGTALTVNDLFAVNGVTTNATSTNTFATNLAATNATTTNFFTTLLNAATAIFTNLTTTNFTATNATSTNFFASVLNAVTGTVNTLTGGAITATSSLTSNGTLNVTGQTTLATASSTGLTVTGGTYLATAGGNVGIGTTTASEKLTVDGNIKINSQILSTEMVTLDAESAIGLRIANPNGYVSVTPLNTSGAHIYTNLPRFYFNVVPVSITGAFSAYSTTDLKLQTGTGGATRMTILATNGNVGIGTTTPGYKLSVIGDGYFGGNLTATGALSVTGAVTASSTLGVIGATTLYSTLNVSGHTTLATASSTGLTATNLYSTNAVLANASTTALTAPTLYSTLANITNGSTTNLTVASNAYFGNNTGIWNASGNVGIGTTTPTTALSVIGSGYLTGGLGLGVVNTTNGTLRTSGNVTVGSNLLVSTILNCNNSSNSLQTDGSGQITCGTVTTIGGSSAGGWTSVAPNIVRLATSTDIVGVGVINPAAKFDISSGNVSTTTLAIRAVNSQIANIFELYDNNLNLSSVMSAVGNFGIGSTTPGSKLSVQGNAYFAGNVTATGTLSVTGQTTLGNASTTGLTTTNLYGTNATIANATSTNFFANLLTAVTGFFTDLTATNATTTNLFVTAFNAITGTVNTLTGGSITATSSLTSNGTLNVTGQTTLGNASTTGLTSSGTLNVTGQTTLGLASSTGLTATNLYSTLANLGTITGTGLNISGQTTLATASSTGLTVTGGTYLATAGGNVGIGTTTPAAKLDISATSYNSFVTRITNTGNTYASGDANGLYIGINQYTRATSYPLYVEVDAEGSSGGPFPSLVVNGLGNVGIGTTTPSSKLSVSGGGITIGTTFAGIAAADGHLHISGNTNLGYNTDQGYRLAVNGAIKLTDVLRGGDGSSSSPAISFINDTDNGLFRATTNTLGISTAGLERMRIDATGNVGIGTTTPGSKLSVQGDTYIGGNVTATGTLSVAGQTTLGNASTTGLTVTNLYATNAIIGTTTFSGNQSVTGTLTVSGTTTLATTSVTSFTATNATTTNFFATLLTAVTGFFTDLTATNATLTNATSTNLFASVLNAVTGTVNTLTGESITATSSLTSNGTLNVTGQTTLTTASSTGLTVTGGTYLATTGGNVGVGTTTPGSKLEVVGVSKLWNGNTIGYTRFENSNEINYYVASGTGSTLFIQYGSNAPTNIGKGALTVVGNNGNVGIGTTTPGSKLSVQGNAYFGGNVTATGTLSVTGQTTLGNASTTNLSTSGTLDVAGKTTLSLASSTGLTATNLYSTLANLGTITGTGLNISGQTTLATASSTGLTVTGGTYLATAGGNVGIGTTTPSRLLDVYNNSSTMVAAFRSAVGTNAAYIQFSNPLSSADQIRIGSTGNRLTLSTNYLERMSVDNAGNVGIGTTTPGSKLSVQGNAYFGGNVTATGTLNVTGQTTLGNASTTVLTAPTLYSTNAAITNASSSNLTLLGSFYDSLSNRGTLGQILFSTGTSTQWLATSSLGITSTGVAGGQTGYAARWLSDTTLGASTLLDDGTVVGVNATSSTISFNVQAAPGINPFNVASSSGASFLSVLANGNIGIGSSTPSSKLTVIGDSYFGGNVIATGTLNIFGQTTLGNASTTGLTATNLYGTNATLTNATSTNVFATSLTSTNATSTNLFATLLNAATAIFTNLAATNATLTNATSTNLFATTLNAITSTINSFTGGSITATSSLTSNGTLNVTGQTTLATASSTGLTATNLYSTVASLGAITGTSLNVTGQTTLTTASSTGLTATNLYATNATLTNATTTNFYTSVFSAATGAFTNLSSTGTSTFATTGGNVGIGTAAPIAKLTVSPNTSGVTNIATSFLAGTNTGLGTTTGSYLYPFEYQANTGNILRLQTAPYRRVDGVSWQGTAFRTQYAVDGSFTDGSKAYVEIGAGDPSVSGGGFISLGTAGFDRLTINDAGNVGIGSTTPGSKLSVQGSAYFGGNVTATGTLNIVGHTTLATASSTGLTATNLYATNATITNATTTNFYTSVFSATTGAFTNASTTNLTVASNAYFGGNTGIWNASGNVGIGTISPTQAKLQINSVALGTSPSLAFSVMDGTYNPRAIISHITATNDQYVKFDSTYSTGSGFADWIFMNGNVGIGTTSPSSLLSVQGSAYFGGNVTATGTLNVTGQTTLTTASSTALTATTLYGTNGILGGTLNVTGKTTLGLASSTALTATNLYSTLANLGAITGTSLNLGSGTITSGAINGQTISSAADFAGTLNVATGFKVGNAAASGSYLRGNGTNFVSSAIQVADVPTLNQNTTGSAGMLLREDNRQISPSELTAGQMRFGFTSFGNSTTSPYADFLHLRSYTDSSGGNDNLLVFNKSSIGMRIYQQAFGTTTAYTSYRDAVLTDTSSANVTLTGNLAMGAGTITSGLINGQTISSAANFTGTVTTAGAIYTTTSSGTAMFTGRQLGAGYAYGDGIFKAITDNATGASNYYFQGVTGGVAGTTNFSVRADGQGYFAGNVGIGTTTPGSLLSVQGNAYFGGNVTATGTLNVAGQTTLGNASTTNFTVASNAYFGGNTGIWNASGNVGIGTLSPLAPLHLSDGNTASSSLLSSDKFLFSYQDVSAGFSGLVASDSAGTRPVFKGTRARGTLADPTAVQNNDDIFSLLSVAFDGATVQATAGIFFKADGNISSGIAPQRISFVTSETTGAARTEKMTIKANGNVGIGSTTPGYKLSVVGDGYFGGNVTATGTLNITGQTTLTTASSTGLSATNLYSTLANLGAITGTTITTSGTSTFATAGGNVGIGTTTPGEKLDIVGNLRLSSGDVVATGGKLTAWATMGGAWAGIEANGINIGDWNTNSSYGDILVGTYDFDVLRDDATSLLTIKNTGNVGIGTTTPGSKLSVQGSAYFGGNLIATGTLNISGQTTLANASSTGLTATNLYATNATITNATTTNFYTSVFSATTGAFTNASTTNLTVASNAYFGNNTGIWNSAGNVGIGTTNPETKLDVRGTTFIGEDLSGSGFLKIAGTGGITYIESGLTTTSGSAADLRFTSMNANDTWMTIKSTGNVGIGTTTPNAKLSIDFGMVGSNANGLNILGSPNYEYGLINAYSNYTDGFGGHLLDITNATGNKFRITNAGNVGIGTPTPGKKLDVQGGASFGAGTYQSGAVVDIGNSGVDYPGNTGWASTFSSNLLLSGLDTTSIGFHDAGTSVGTLGYTSNKFFMDGSASWGPVSFGINDRTPDARLDVTGDGSTIALRVDDSGEGDATPFIINASGNVGIGTTNPLNKLQVSIPTNADQMTLGSTTGVAFSVVKGDEGYGLYTGISGTGNTWLQAGRTDTATAYNLSLQAAGGNVGIGTTNPGTKLDVSGVIRSYVPGSDSEISQVTSGGTTFAWQTFNTVDLKLHTDASGGRDILGILGNNGFVGIGTTNPVAKLNVVNVGGAGQQVFADQFSSDQNASTVRMRKARGTDISPAVITNGDYLSSFEGWGYDGSAFRRGFYVASVVNGTPSSGNMPTDLAFAVNSGSTDATEMMRLTKSGYLGIGTSSPAALLHLEKNFTATGLSEMARFTHLRSDIGDADDGGYLSFKVVDGNNNGNTYDHARISWRNNGSGADENEGELAFWTADNGTTAERMTISNTGNVGIGSTTPGSKLTVAGNSYFGGNVTATGSLVLGVSTSATGTLVFQNSLNAFTTTVRGSSTLAGNLTFTLPGTTGSAGNSLLSDGTGGMYWASSTGAGVTGGQNGYVARFTGATSVATGTLRDNGIVAGVNATSSSYSFNVQGAAGVNPFNVASSTGTSLFAILKEGNVAVGTTTSFSLAKILIDSATSASGATSAIGGIHGNYTFNPTAGGVQVGNRFVVNNMPTTNANTSVAQVVRTIDNTGLANTVRGLEVVSNAGSNTQGINTGIRTTGATFGLQAFTSGMAGGSTAPAAIYGENTGTTGGDMLRLYSSTITTAPHIAQFYQEGSNYSGTGLHMNLGTGGGSFTGNFLDLQNNDVTKFVISSAGNVGIGTTSPAGKLAITGAGTGTDITFLAANSSNGQLLTVLDNGTIGVGTNPTYTSSIYGKLLSQSADASTTPNFTALTAGSAQGEISDIALYSTFQGTGDNGPRRTADIVAGFNGGAWGNEYLAFGVGINGAANDSRRRTSEKMRITDAGNVGIGTTTPGSTLTVAGNSLITGTLAVGTKLTINGPSSTSTSHIDLNPGSSGLNDSAVIKVNGRARFGYDGGRTAVFIDDNLTNKPIVFDSAGAERMRITTTGNVGIGDSSPDSLLTIADAYRVYASSTVITSDGSGTTDSVYLGRFPTGMHTIQISYVGNSGYNSAEIVLAKDYDSADPDTTIEVESWKSSSGASEVTSLHSVWVDSYHTDIFLLFTHMAPAAANISIYYNVVSASNIAITNAGSISPTLDSSNRIPVKFAIGTTGNVGIGTTTPAAKFAVQGSAYFGGNVTATGTLNVTGQTTLATASSTGLTATNLYSTLANLGAITGTSLNLGSGTITSGLINGQTISSAANFTGTLSTAGVITSAANGAKYFQGGDDAAFYDENIANTVGIRGVQDGTIASVRLGSAGGVLSGYNGNIGIGTTNPQTKLQIDDATSRTVFTGNAAGSALIREGNGTGHFSTLDFAASGSTNGYPQSRIGSLQTAGGSYLYFGTSNNYTAGITNSGMVLDYNGNLGIGTTNPGAKLTVAPASPAPASGIDSFGLLTTGSFGGGIGLEDGTGNFGIWLDTAGTYSRFGFGTSLGALSPVMSMSSSGNVGIGTLSPGGKLDVQGGRSYFSAASEQYGVGVKYVSTGGAVYFGAASGSATPDAVISASGGATLMTLQNNGNVGIGTTPNAKLNVAGTIFANNAGNDSGIYISGEQGAYGMLQAVNAANNAARNLVLQQYGGNVGIGLTGPTIKLAIGDSDTGLNWSGDGALDIYSNNVNTMNIRSGNVGIGTTGPSGKLQVDKDTSNIGDETSYALRLTDGNLDTGLLFGVNAGGDYAVIQSLDPGNSWATRPLAIMPNGGKVGIGNASPSYPLHVTGTIYATSGDICSSLYGCLSSFSDQRLKENVQPLGSTLDRVMQLKPVTYKWNQTYLDAHEGQAGATSTKIGFLAQDVLGLFPETVNPQDHNGYYTLDYDKFVPVLASAIQEQQAQINPLTRSITVSSSTLVSARLFINDSTGVIGIGNNATALDGELLRVSGTVRAQGFDTDNAADIAETFSATEAVDAGTIVAFSTTTYAWSPIGVTSTASTTYEMSGVRKALTGNEAIGIVSTKPGIRLGGTVANGVPVAFTGRVPVRVTNENGEIKRGDYITVSDTRGGYGMKLTGEGRAIGIALSDDTNAGTVLVLLQVGNHKLDMAGRYATTTGMLTTGNVDLNANGVAIYNIKSLASANGTWSIDENGRITVKSLCIDGNCLDGEGFGDIIATSKRTGQMQVVGSYGYLLNAKTHTLTVLDMSTAESNPAILATLVLPEGASSVAVSGSLLYVSNDDMSMIYLIDVSAPASPYITRTIDMNNGGMVAGAATSSQPITESTPAETVSTEASSTVIFDAESSGFTTDTVVEEPVVSEPFVSDSVVTEPAVSEPTTVEEETATAPVEESVTVSSL